MNKRESTFDNLKFVLIVLVVVGHCIEPYCKMAESFKSAFCFIYFLHMPGFIFVSGLFSKKAASSRERTREKIFYFLSLYLLLKIFITVLRMLFYKDYSFDLFTTDGLPWFMFVMASYYALTYLLRKYDHRFVLLLSVLLGCFVGYDKNIGGFLCLSRVIVYYPLFFLGYIIEPQEIIRRVNRLYMRIIGTTALIFFAWICYFRLDIIWKVKPLFSGKNPFSALPHPAYGALYRLLYYIVISFYILCMVAVVPKRKNIFTTLGQRTIQVYFLHFMLLYPMRVYHVFDSLQILMPGKMWKISSLVIGFVIAVFFSLPIWRYPFDAVQRLSRINIDSKE